MKLKVNGIDIPVQGQILVQVETEPGGEELPPIVVNVTGGTLQVYRSRVIHTGPVSIHLFGAEMQGEEKYLMLSQDTKAGTYVLSHAPLSSLPE